MLFTKKELTKLTRNKWELIPGASKVDTPQGNHRLEYYWMHHEPTGSWLDNEKGWLDSLKIQAFKSRDSHYRPIRPIEYTFTPEEARSEIERIKKRDCFFSWKRKLLKNALPVLELYVKEHTA